MTLDWRKIRAGWRVKAEKWARDRAQELNRPDHCACDEGEQYWCQFCDDVQRYMKTMEEHADVLTGDVEGTLKSLGLETA